MLISPWKLTVLGCAIVGQLALPGGNELGEESSQDETDMGDHLTQRGSATSANARVDLSGKTNSTGSDLSILGPSA